MGTDKEGPLYREETERFWFVRLITEVRDDGIYVRLEPLQRSFRQIRPDQIQQATVTSYGAATYAGWHWGAHRTPGGNMLYRLRGERGVQIQLQNGVRWFIGSQRPEELKSAIKEIGIPAE